MGDKPSIKKVEKGPYNKAKIKNPQFFNISVRKISAKVKMAAIRKKPRPLHNESLTKGEVHRKEAFSTKYEKYKEKNNIEDEHPERVNMYGAFQDEEEINKAKRNKVSSIVIGIMLLIYIVIKLVGCIEDNVADKERKAKIFKGKEYFSYLGISKTDQFEESLYEIDDLSQVDNIAVGKYSYEGETYYRFQAKKDGRLAYDSEITNYQGEIENVIEGTKPVVEVYKRIYSKSNGNKVSVFYYRLKVPQNKVKTLS